jgi:mitochondrial intermembrane space import and assembly protein 40
MLLLVAHMRTAPPAFSDDDMPTVEAIIEEKRKKALAAAPPPPPPPQSEQPAKTAAVAAAEEHKSETPKTAEGQAPGSPEAEALEQEASEQGAFNPETGEINWDCPCLGGMAHGPCGEEFKAAFSCFVYSEAEPKGMDCIEKFQ